jgi:outer membrane beta-barrel protein
MRTRSLLLAALSMGLVAGPAGAEPLSEQPAVRHKYELRSHRFEITPTFEASLAAYFKHTLAGGLKLEYHITDSLSVGGMVFFGTGINTGLMSQIVDSLGPDEKADQTPSQSQALDHVNTIPVHGGLGVTFTPWFGKLGLFGRAFLSYDIYVSGGFGFAQTSNKFSGGDDETMCEHCSDASQQNDPNNDGPHNAGFNPGVQFGGGLHVYFSGFAGLDVYIRDYMFTDNPSGLDFNHDKLVTNADRRFLSHLFVGVGVAFFLPPKAKISR